MWRSRRPRRCEAFCRDFRPRCDRLANGMSGNIRLRTVDAITGPEDDGEDGSQTGGFESTEENRTGKGVDGRTLESSRVCSRGERHFAGDRRYDLQSVLDGFASRIDDSDGDQALLERICAAYQK